MSKKNVFFSFHYTEDNWRASQVRNSQITKPANNDLAFYDWAEWESVKYKTESVIKSWIDNQLHGTSVTVILITSETAGRKYVAYEALKSHERGNGIIGLKIHGLKNRNGIAGVVGEPYFGQIFKDRNGSLKYFGNLYKTYNYVEEDGYNNLSKWIHQAAIDAGK